MIMDFQKPTQKIKMLEKIQILKRIIKHAPNYSNHRKSAEN
jgi:hypothetical protein